MSKVGQVVHEIAAVQSSRTHEIATFTQILRDANHTVGAEVGIAGVAVVVAVGGLLTAGLVFHRIARRIRRGSKARKAAKQSQETEQAQEDESGPE